MMQSESNPYFIIFLLIAVYKTEWSQLTVEMREK